MQELLDRLENIGHGVLVRKVKGHATAADVLAGRTTAPLKRGNDAADHFAVRAKKLASDLSPVGEVVAAARRSTTYYSWVARVVQHWEEQRTAATATPSPGAAEPANPTNADNRAEDRHRRAGRRERLATATGRPAQGGSRNASTSVHGALPHRLWAIGNKWKCSACQRTASTPGARKAMARTPCGGTAAARVVTSATGGHVSTQLRIAEVERSLRRMGAEVVHTEPPKKRRRRAVGLDEVPTSHAVEQSTSLSATSAPNAEVSHPGAPTQTMEAIARPAIDDTTDATVKEHGIGDHDIYDEVMFRGDMDIEGETGIVYGSSADGMVSRGTAHAAHTEASEGPPRGTMPGSSTDAPAAKRPKPTPTAATPASARGSEEVGTAPHWLAHPRLAGEDAHRPSVKRRRINVKTTPAAPDAPAQRAVDVLADAPPPAEHNVPTQTTLPRTESRWGYGHKLSVTAGLVWCRTCGHHAAVAVRSLARPCKGPASGPYVSRLRRLRAGIHPVTGRALE